MGVCGIRTCVLPERDDGAAGISDQVNDEPAEARRERFQEEIIRLGQEKLEKGKSHHGPNWNKPPEMRGWRGKAMAEKIVIEESWE